MNRILRIASRTSPLARVQVREVMGTLESLDTRWVGLDSFGDRHKDVSLWSNRKEDIFTDVLDEALLRGEVDAAIHSAKDLPFPLRDGLVLAALTEGMDSRDALVSRSGQKLRDLPPGATVGTSSPSRRDQLKLLRHDLRPVDIRGTIEERLHRVETGEVDALIVALCALQRLGLEPRASEILPFQTHPLQGKLAVVCAAQNAECRGLFHSFDVRKTYGKVWLVGAGPGSPDLMTIRAQKVLARADVVYYDDLTDGSLQTLFHGRCEYVGKRKGRAAFSQDEIQEKLYRSALQGEEVVRLKGGDPSIFGRVGEEVEFLLRRWVPVEVVPGVTSASAGAASASFPLTRRHIAKSVSFFSGHDASGETTEAPQKNTCVYYMASSKLSELSNELLLKGFTAETPVAVVGNAGGYDELCVTGNLSDAGGIKVASPALFFVGDVTAFARIEKKALYVGLDPEAVYLHERIIHQPLIETVFSPRPDENLPPHDAVLFTSRTAVDAYLKLYDTRGSKVLAIGSATAERLKSHGVAADIVSLGESSEDLARIVREGDFRTVLYPCSDLSDNALHRLPNVHPRVLYRTVHRQEAPLNLSFFSSVVFSSPSTVEAFKDLYGVPPNFLLCYVFGEKTREALLRLGVQARRIVDCPRRRHAHQTI